LNQSGITVNCIFSFCDIRQFTDATEALQEEVFVFTNKIAFVVHSISHAYGGSANKNIGNAFLVTWKLSDDPSGEIEEDPYAPNAESSSQQADKALYSVIKIRLALYNDSYFLKELGAAAKGRLLEKLGDGKGPVVRVSALFSSANFAFSFCLIWI
jgi:class 3 adenylate cyclase